MSQELGRIEKPPVEGYRAGRRLFFVPLVFSLREPAGDFSEKVNRYWEQVEAHVANLEGKLGEVNKVYHEWIPQGGEEGLKAVEELNPGSFQIVKARLQKGGELWPIEDVELLTEFMDWSKCLAVGLQNQRVLARVYESYVEAQKRRNSHIAQQIEETLKDQETGILLMREGHQVQFPPDIEVFYVAPPGLDDLKRWLRERRGEAQTGSGNDSRAEPECP